MRRRRLLTGGFVGLMALTSGCLEGIDAPGENETPSATPTPPPPGEAISYHELTDHGQVFIDAAMDGHTVRYVDIDGERRYLSTDDDGFFIDDDPLLPGDSSKLQMILSGDALLEHDDDFYSMLFATGHGPVGFTLETTQLEECPSETVEVDELPEDEIALAEELLEATTLTVAEPDFEAVLKTEHTLPDDSLLELAVVAMEQDTCLTEDETPHQLLLEEHFFFMDDYKLLPVEGTN